jgi:hypothetical protein
MAASDAMRPCVSARFSFIRCGWITRPRASLASVSAIEAASMASSGSRVSHTLVADESPSSMRTIASSAMGLRPRSMRHRLMSSSAVDGLRFCAIVELPTLPMWKASAASPTSVRCMKTTSCAIFWALAASIASALT